ncbi:class I SAM-dependent methyltransferase [Patescibacteria group bacterium]|nr:class I SAM-dependent methyltransferase [Patescibacteria group bacterium]MBU1472813.1 class I SAM-dependent methyltransferase [Patescibacteria group bacterium]MBU2460379.1 class I SAM-dependent methyltransferase [Patescibacteria group bacterium]MBU2544043.1 class I SAM-dependent methyltransferase [Patescibacteria group bacterium]
MIKDVPCGHNKLIFYKSVNRWQIYRCDNCGLLITVVNQGSGNINKDIYNDRYIKAYEEKKDELKKRFLKQFELIRKYKKGGKILDIGCGLGYFLQVVENDRAWTAYGLEINKKLALLAKKNTVADIHIGSLNALPYDKNSMDCITCFDVLEHDIDLYRNLINIRRILKTKGIIVIQCPNYKSLMQYLSGSHWDWWSPPDHILHLTPKTLTTYLRRCGFSILYSTTYEPTRDFWYNVKFALCRNVFCKLILYTFAPTLLVIKYISDVLGYGALTFIIAIKD